MSAMPATTIKKRSYQHWVVSALSGATFGLAVTALTVFTAFSAAQASERDLGAVATIEASTSRQVLPDEVHVTFSTQAQGQTAPQVNRQLAAAIEQARKGFVLPDGVELSTGHFSVYLDHGKDNQPRGWTGRASLQAVSTNLDQTSLLIEHFSKTLAVSSLRFSLSSDLRREQEKQMMNELARDFADRAHAVAQAFGFKGYELIGLDFTDGQGFTSRAAMQSTARAMSLDASAPTLSLEPALVPVEISVNGRIRLN